MTYRNQIVHKHIQWTPQDDDDNTPQTVWRVYVDFERKDAYVIEELPADPKDEAYPYTCMYSSRHWSESWQYYQDLCADWREDESDA